MTDRVLLPLLIDTQTIARRSPVGRNHLELRQSVTGALDELVKHGSLAREVDESSGLTYWCNHEGEVAAREVFVVNDERLPMKAVGLSRMIALAVSVKLNNEVDEAIIGHAIAQAHGFAS